MEDNQEKEDKLDFSKEQKESIKSDRIATFIIWFLVSGIGIIIFIVLLIIFLNQK